MNLHVVHENRDLQFVVAVGTRGFRWFEDRRSGLGSGSGSEQGLGLAWRCFELVTGPYLANMPKKSFVTLF